MPSKILRISKNYMYNVTYVKMKKMWGNTDWSVHKEASHPNQSALCLKIKVICVKKWKRRGDAQMEVIKKKGCFKCGEEGHISKIGCYSLVLKHYSCDLSEWHECVCGGCPQGAVLCSATMLCSVLRYE